MGELHLLGELADELRVIRAEVHEEPLLLLCMCCVCLLIVFCCSACFYCSRFMKNLGGPPRPPADVRSSIRRLA